MSDYFDREKDASYGKVYKSETPEMLKGFMQFDGAVFAAEGPEIPLKYRELMAVAVGVTTQCAYCIDAHTKRAVKAGATQRELAEASWVAAAIQAGGAFAHGRLAFKFGEEATAHSH